MKFNVSSSKLFSQLQAVSRVINSKNALPILDDVLFDLAGNELRLTASDGETTIRTSVEVEGVEGSGKVASAAKLLLETLKEFSEQPLAFTIDENNFAVNMVSQNGTYSFVGVNGNEYPEMPEAEGDAKVVNMPAGVLQSAIEKTIFCTADDELRPVMNGRHRRGQSDDGSYRRAPSGSLHERGCESRRGCKFHPAEKTGKPLEEPPGEG